MEYNVLIYSCWTERCWIIIVLRYGIQCVVILLLDRKMLDRHSSEVWNTMCCYTAAGQMLDRHSSEVWNTMCCYTAAGQMLDRHSSELLDRKMLDHHSSEVWNTIQCVDIQLLDRKMLDRHSSEVWNTMCCYTAAGQKDAGSS
ncbi:Hypothetical predicted protein [Mytilus galloprovincialis]|uniref:Uncharacterized protein n=1 Tax=Mytilus galloprovincialis TaxID=29158 RepID=A0A8B6CEZ5_MYTGA|nr:Hypothetical predicted protein [Mytilus galloprovincialis]